MNNCVTVKSIVHECTLTLVITDQITNDERELINLVNAKKADIIFIRRKPLSMLQIEKLCTILLSTPSYMFVSRDYDGSEVFVYFTKEKIKDSSLEKLKNWDNLNVTTFENNFSHSKSYTPPPAKKRFTKSQRKKMKK